MSRNRKVLYHHHDDVADNIAKLKAQGVGVEEDHNRYTLRSDEFEMDSLVLEQVKGFIFQISEVRCVKPITFKESVEDSERIVVRFIRNAQVEQRGKQSEHLGKGAENGLCIYSSKYPCELVMPLNETVQILAMKIEVETWHEVTKHYFKQLNETVRSTDHWILFEKVTSQMDTELERLFDTQKLVYGRRGFSLGRCTDLFTYVLLLFQNQIEHNEGKHFDCHSLFQIKHELEERLKCPPTMEELVEKYHMSATKLRRNFKSAFGLPPHQYVIRYRLEEAFKRVLHTTETLNCIALDLGFTDLAHFSSRFKKHFGESPSALRESVVDVG